MRDYATVAEQRPMWLQVVITGEYYIEFAFISQDSLESCTAIFIV